MATILGVVASYWGQVAAFASMIVESILSSKIMHNSCLSTIEYASGRGETCSLG